MLVLAISIKESLLLRPAKKLQVDLRDLCESPKRDKKPRNGRGLRGWFRVGPICRSDMK